MCVHHGLADNATPPPHACVSLRPVSLPTAMDATRALLDELMGVDRNGDREAVKITVRTSATHTWPALRRTCAVRGRSVLV